MKRILAVVLASSLPVIAFAVQPAAPQAAAIHAPAPVAASVAPAFPPASQASLDKLVEVARISLIHDSIEKTLDQSAERVNMFTTARLRGITLTPAEKTQVDSLPGQVKALIAAQFSTDTVKGIFAKEYATKFDQKEVDGLIAFYSSPVGQEFAAKQLEINTEVTVQLQKTIGSLGVQVQKAINAVVSPIMKAHEPKAAAVPGKAPLNFDSGGPHSVPAKPAAAAPATTAAKH